MRRGRGESSGTYVEECSVYIGQCTVAEQTVLLEHQLHEAVLDSNAVIDQLILGRIAPRQSKMLFAGISRGGFLSLMLAGERPEVAEGIVNFVGGWIGVTDRLTAQDIQQRMETQKAMLTRAAKRTSAPSIWFYAARDPYYYYKEGVPQELHRNWLDTGGRADFVYIDNPTLTPGNAIAPQAALWERRVDAFLQWLDKGKS